MCRLYQKKDLYEEEEMTHNCCCFMVASIGTVAFAEEETEAAPSAIHHRRTGKTEHFELWSFMSVHNEFYANMVNEWNEQNPDKQIQITFSTYRTCRHNKP